MFATAVLEESLSYFPKPEGPLPCVLLHSRPTFNKSQEALQTTATLTATLEIQFLENITASLDVLQFLIQTQVFSLKFWPRNYRNLLGSFITATEKPYMDSSLNPSVLAQILHNWSVLLS